MKPFERVTAIADGARERGRDVLLETEGLAVLEALGIPAPAYRFVEGSAAVDRLDLDALGGDQVVIKVISPEILHKSDVGGVRVVARDCRAIADAIADMERSFAGKAVEGYTINQYVAYSQALGNELLLGMRYAPDFGPVVTFGPGGIYTEYLAGCFKTGAGPAILSAELESADTVGRRIRKVGIMPLVAGGLRGQKARVDVADLTRIVGRFLDVARELVPHVISELEINPLVIASGKLVALDILVKLGDGSRPEPGARPVAKIRSLLEPRTAAVIGASAKMNVGRTILRKMLAQGFPRENLFVVKEGTDELDGCRCVPDVASLPECVDLLVVSIAASDVPALITQTVEKKKAQSIILIPGGLEEKQGTGEILAHMRSALARSRSSEWGGPVINGGNCLGIRSLPGRYDTLFIPGHKLPPPAGPQRPVALISQSGAFAVCRMSKLPGIDAKYVLSMGNQMDLTVGDYLTYLKDDREISLYAVYVEGFRPGDGTRFLRAAREITASGRSVVLYRAGRTAAGAKATASHTASIAGDYAVTRELCEASDVIVVDTEDDFDQLVELFCCLGDKEVRGTRIGAISNGGFECVAMADNHARFSIPAFSTATVDRLGAIFQQARIDGLVDVHNPIDLTPMAPDAAYEETVRAVLSDEGVDVGVVGCIPLTPACATLAAGAGHAEDIEAEGSLVSRLLRLKRELGKAWVVVCDAGPLYDPMYRRLAAGGIPTFKTADRALAVFDLYCAERLRIGR